MGKKRIIKQDEKSVLEEKEKIERALEKSRAAKLKGKLVKGRIYLYCSYNNTTLTLTDQKGNVIFWSSAGRMGFRGPKKATPFAATKVVESISEKVVKGDEGEYKLFVNGIGSGREAALKALVGLGINITYIRDVTPIPHNGPRPPKPRRV